MIFSQKLRKCFVFPTILGNLDLNLVRLGVNPISRTKLFQHFVEAVGQASVPVITGTVVRHSEARPTNKAQYDLRLAVLAKYINSKVLCKK